MAQDGQWYVQKGSRVQGPFTPDEVGRFLLLGRVRNTDRVSRDGEMWEPVTQVPELIPEELLDLGSETGWERYLASYSALDERGSESRRHPGHTPASGGVQVADQGAYSGSEWRSERRAGSAADRRQTSFTATQETVRDAWLSTSVQRPRPLSPRVLPWSLLGITMAALCLALWLNTTVVAGS